MYIDNQYTFGHLIDSETFDITLKNPEVYQLFENRYDWEQRYIHPDYMKNFNTDIIPAQVTFQKSSFRMFFFFLIKNIYLFYLKALSRCILVPDFN